MKCYKCDCNMSRSEVRRWEGSAEEGVPLARPMCDDCLDDEYRYEDAQEIPYSDADMGL